MQNLFFATAGAQLIVVDSADFDGTNDKMERGSDLSGNADSKSGICSVWIRLDGGDGGAQRVITGSVSGGAPTNVLLEREAGNTFAVTGRNSVASDILFLRTSGTYTAGATWLHILSSWNLAATVGHLYINDVSDVDSGATILTDDTIDYTQNNYCIGSVVGGLGFLLNGCAAELYFAPGQYLDFSIVANRRKFISSSGKPVYLGADGSAPTGTAPIVYQQVANGAAVATFATNLGTGGDFAITGTLVTGSTSPSD